MRWRLNSRAEDQSNPAAPPPAAPAALPKGKIGKLEVSRLILGGNLLTHYTHSRDLKYVYTLAAHYNTDEKIMETLAEGGGGGHQHGLDAQPGASDLGPAALPQGARRQDSMDHLPHRAGRAGHGQVPRARREP